MIFVTVGTHEQQFDRLLKKIDNLIEIGCIDEEVIIQSGFSKYVTKYCKSERIIPYSEMIKNIKEARIIITHGGPATFIMPLQEGKIPIVVPRQKQYNEHINNHQVEFVQSISKRMGSIIPVIDIEDLASTIENYNNIIITQNASIISNNKSFNKEFDKIVQAMFET